MSTTTHTTCLACDRYDATGGYLCLPCTAITREHIRSLPGLYAALGAFLAPAGGGGQGRGSTPAYAPLPVREDVLDLRGPGGLVAPLESWVDAIRAERRQRERAHTGSPTGRVRRATDELLGHLPWIAVSFTEAGSFAGEIRDLTRSVRSILQPQDRGLRLGRCVAVTPDGDPCGATLRLMPGEKAVNCRWCGVSWPPVTWPQLKTWQDEDAAHSAESQLTA